MVRWGDLANPAAFDAYILTVDARLRDQGVDIQARPLHACSLISEECHVKFMMGSDVFERINTWFQDRYGEKLKIDMNVGMMLVHLNGDPFLVRFPVIYGTWRVNPLEWIEKATEKLLGSLDPDWIEDLAKVILRGFEAFNQIRGTLPPALTADLDVAPAYVLGRPPQTGMSKWASQQAVEKTLSAYLERQGVNPRKKAVGESTHDLFHLDHLAQGVGLPACDHRFLKAVDCRPKIRYPEREQTSVVQAVLANQASVQLCRHVAEHWRWGRSA